MGLRGGKGRARFRASSDSPPGEQNTRARQGIRCPQWVAVRHVGLHRYRAVVSSAKRRKATVSPSQSGRPTGPRGRRSRAERFRGYGTDRQLPSGRWQPRVPDDKGGTYNPHPGVTYETREDSEAARIAYVTDKRRGLLRERSDVPTLREWVDRWLPAHIGELAPGTKVFYRDLFKNVVLAPEAGLADLPLDEVTEIAVQEGLGRIADRHSTSRREQGRKALGMAMRSAIRSRLIDGPDPTEGVRVGRRGSRAEERREPFYCYTAELVAIASAAHLLDIPHYTFEDWPLAFETMMWSGMRVGELLALDPVQLLSEVNIILVTHGMSRGVRDTPKSGRARYASVPAHLMERLVRHARDNQIEPGFPMFPDTEGKWLHNKRLNKMWHAAVDLSGVGAEPTSALAGRRGKPGKPAIPIPKDLRASFVSHLLAAGIPDADVRAQVGHEDKSTTDLYTQVHAAGAEDPVAIDARTQAKPLRADVIDYLYVEAWTRYGGGLP